jgi:predicted RNase H-like HicB family nuclease
MNQTKNTKEKGVIEFIVFPDKKEKKYVGVCLTFDLLEEGETLEEVRYSIIEASKLHLETVIKNNLSEDLLNRKAPKEYWDKLDEMNILIRKHQIKNMLKAGGPVSQYLYPYKNSQLISAFA